MTITVILKGKTDQHGKIPLQLRINDGASRSFIPLKIKVLPKDFDKEKGLVKSSNPNAKDHNNLIRIRLLEVETSGYKKEKTQEINLITYCLACLSDWENTKSAGTIRAQQGEANKLKRYDSAVMLSGITAEWLTGYKKHLFGLGNAHNTVWDSLKFVRTIVLKAMREKLIKDDPFEAFETIQYKDPKINFLIREQVDAIEAVALDADMDSKVRLIASWFVIGCYTGLRFGDIAAFNREKHIKKGRLVVVTEKTDEQISILINDKVKMLLESIDYKPIQYTNQFYNRTLKQIAAYAGIKEKITAHTSRHTFGTMAMDSGIRMDVVSELMGHRNIKTTKIYAKIFNPLIDSEMKKMG